STRNTRDMIAPSHPKTTYSRLKFSLLLKNFTATKLVTRNATDTPVDDISTIQLSAVRPSHGAARHTSITKSTAMYGVLFLWCSLANTDGMKCARPSANRSLDEDMKNPWSPVKIPNDMASASSAMPSPPMEVCTTDPATHRAPPSCSWPGHIQHVTSSTSTYVHTDASRPN